MGLTNLGATCYMNSAIQTLYMTPEFRNRLDSVIPFSQLSVEMMEKIVDSAIAELTQKLLSMSIKLTVSDAARSWLVQNGKDPELGARPLIRLIEKELKQPLADYILFKLKQSGRVSVSISSDKTSLDIRFEQKQATREN